MEIEERIVGILIIGLIIYTSSIICSSITLITVVPLLLLIEARLITSIIFDILKK